jgi:hypothetical protein
LKRTWISGAIAVGVLTVAACGGDESSTATVPPAAAEAANGAESNDAASPPPASDNAAAPSGDVLVGDCSDEQAIDGAFNSMNPGGKSAEEKRKDFEVALAYFETKGKDAPGDLADDFKLVEQYFRALYDVLSPIDFDVNNLTSNPEVATRFATMASEFDMNALPVAFGNVTRYIAETCR